MTSVDSLGVSCAGHGDDFILLVGIGLDWIGLEQRRQATRQNRCNGVGEVFYAFTVVTCLLKNKENAWRREIKSGIFGRTYTTYPFSLLLHCQILLVVYNTRRLLAR